MKPTNHNTKRISNFRLGKKNTDSLPFNLFNSLGVCHEVHDIPSLDIATSALGSQIDDCISTASGSIKEVERFRGLYQAKALLKKYPFASNDAACRDTAFGRFLEAEDRCRATNFRLRNLRCSDDVNIIAYKARKLIAQVLGKLHVPALVDLASFGPGLTNGVEGCHRSAGETTYFFKYTDDLSATKECLPFARYMVSKDRQWSDLYWEKYSAVLRPGRTLIENEVAVLTRCCQSVKGNRITFVPKDRSTHRTIAIEPGGNVALQLGVGKHIRSRLGPFGVSLNDQTKNQRMAREGSVEGADNDPNQLCTIDLEMASDTLSIEAVKDLLPPEWFDYLYCLRSHCGTIDDRLIEYEKFSSMGNGYTFELESLVFYALSASVMKHLGFRGRTHSDLAVFGDDIVIRQPYVAMLIEVLEWYGFTVNAEKSFTSGPFKESCGKDFYFGHDVRPFFLRRKIRSIRDLQFVANSLMYKSIVNATPLYWECYRLIFETIPKHFRLYGPLHLTFIDRGNPRHRRLWEKLPFYEREKVLTDQLEGCLRVPFSFAFEGGHYRLSGDPGQFGYTELQVAPKVVSGHYEDNRRPYTTVGRYLTFLRGVSGGNIILRGVTTTKLKYRYSSCWDGNFASRSLRYSPL